VIVINRKDAKDAKKSFFMINGLGDVASVGLDDGSLLAGVYSMQVFFAYFASLR
jgi:hypothetical protein